jgi:hypothetical protein
MVGGASSADGSQDKEVTPSNFSGARDDFACVFVHLTGIEKFKDAQSARATHVRN